FEVGGDVLAAFGVDTTVDRPSRFVATRPGKWLADLSGLARDRLAAAGVVSVEGGECCTFAEGSRFFSYRRDGRTGRMAAAVWIDSGNESEGRDLGA
ncbi:MAG: laccase domain-containing protein, partial [Pseudomonadota bacterium]|nr:laccase domain-containing protein [Pseudomonadota bacterium]